MSNSRTTQTKTFEAGFEPALTREQKESIKNAQKGIDNAVNTVNEAASKAHDALDQSLQGHRHLITVGVSSESTPCAPPKDEHPGILSSAKEAIGDTIHSVKKKLIGGAETAKNAVGDALGETKELGQEAMDTTRSFAGSAYDKAVGMLNTAKNETMDAAGKVYSKTANLMESVKDSAGEKMEEATDTAKSLKRKAEDKFSSVSAKSDNDHGLTLEEVERRGLTVDYPALLRGYDQNLPSYTTVIENEQSDLLRSGAESLGGVGHEVSSAVKDVAHGIADVTSNVGHGIANVTSGVGHGIANVTSDVGHGIANVTSGVGHGIANAASGAYEASKDFIGSVGGQMKGAVNAVIGETPPNRELEQRGEQIIRESRLNPLLQQQYQKSSELPTSDSNPVYFVDRQELRTVPTTDPRQIAPTIDPRQQHLQEQEIKDNFHFQNVINRPF